MKNIVSKAQLQRAEDAVNQALLAAYGPMDVQGEQLCWEGRIRRAVEKADELINSGKLTRDKVQGIIDGFQHEYDEALHTARKAQDTYFDLCKQATVAPKRFQRPQCPCAACAERIRYEAADGLEQAVQAMLESFTDDTVATARRWWQQCQKLGVTVELDFFLSKVAF